MSEPPEDFTLLSDEEIAAVERARWLIAYEEGRRGINRPPVPMSPSLSAIVTAHREGGIVEVRDDTGGPWTLARVVRHIGGIPDRPTHYTVRFFDRTLGIFDTDHVRPVEASP